MSNNNLTGNTIASWLSAHENELIRTSDYLFCHPETAYQEKLSSKYLAEYLESKGFFVSYQTAGIETAFTAVWQSDDSTSEPVIGFLAEYDALPELGHACGHNLLGTAVCGAA